MQGSGANPFAEQQDAPVPYAIGSQDRAIAKLLRSIHAGNVLHVLTGPSGVGKSVALRGVLAALARERMRVVALDNSYTPEWSLRLLIGHILGRPVEGPIERGMASAFAKLSTAPAGELAIVVAVDDAQTLTDQALEYLLGIASLARHRTPPLQFVLVGRGEFWEREWPSELAAFIAHMGIRITLAPLHDDDATAYVVSRLAQFGKSLDDIATPEALAVILRHGKGLPRQIDRIFAAAIDHGAGISPLPLWPDIVEQAVGLLEPRPRAHDPPKPPRAAPQPRSLLTASILSLPGSVPADTYFAAARVPGAIIPSSPASSRRASGIRVRTWSPSMLDLEEIARLHREHLARSLAAQRRHRVRVAILAVAAACFSIGIADMFHTQVGSGVDRAVGGHWPIAFGRLTPTSDTAPATPSSGFVTKATSTPEPGPDGAAQGATSSSVVVGSRPTLQVGAAGAPQAAVAPIVSEAPSAAPARQASATPVDGVGVNASIAPGSAPLTGTQMTGRQIPAAAGSFVADPATDSGAGPGAGTEGMRGGGVGDELPATKAAPVRAASVGLGASARTDPVNAAPIGGQMLMPAATSRYVAASTSRDSISATDQPLPDAPQPPLLLGSTTSGPPAATATLSAATTLLAADVHAGAASSVTAPAADAPPRSTAPVSAAALPDSTAPVSTGPVSSGSGAGAVTAAPPPSNAATSPAAEVYSGATASAPPTQEVPQPSDVPAIASPASSAAIVEAAERPPAAGSHRAAPTQAPQPPTLSAPTSTLSPQMVAVLLRRGDDLLGEGDISGARLFYERAAAAGSARGASGAGRTYDPAFLARIDVRGLRGDTVRAIDWYRKAIELGDKGAAEPLKALIDLTGR